MASSIPRARRKEYTDAQAAKSLYVALFVNLTGYDALTATTYAALAATATEVSPSGTGYTTGGYALTGLTSSNVGSTNVAILTASATSVTAGTFTARYGVIYDHTTGKIEGVSDFLADKTVTGGTMSITWDMINGLENVA